MNPAGQPLAGAEVQLLRPFRGDLLQGVAYETLAKVAADADGRFTFAVPRPQPMSLTVLATAPSLAAASTTVSRGTHWFDLEIPPLQLTAGYRLVGSLVSEDAGDPIADAEVTIHAESAMATLLPPRQSTHSDALGAFKIDGISTDQVTLKISAPGYATAWRRHVPLDPLDARPLRRTFELASAATLTVQLQDRRGVPVPHAMVAVTSTGPLDLVLAQATTDGQGRVVFEDLEQGYCSLRVDHPDFVTHHEPRVHTDVAQLRVELERRSRIRLTFPELPAEQDWHCDVLVFQATADEQLLLGRPAKPAVIRSQTLQVPGLASGDYVIEVRLPGIAPVRSPKVTVFPGTDTDGGELRLEAGGSICGRILGADETGVAALVAIAPRYLTEVAARHSAFALEDQRLILTEPSGEFSIPGLAPGDYTLSVQGQQLATRTVSPIAVAASQVTDLGNLTLSATGTLQGRIVDKSQRPVIDAWITLERGPETRSTQSGRDGEYQFRGLAPGTYRVRIHVAQAPDGTELATALAARPGPIAVVEITSGETTHHNFSY